MAVQEYFKQAAAQIRRAAFDKRHEIDVKRKELADKEREIHQKVQSLKDDQRRHEARAGSAGTSDQERIVNLQQVQRDSNEIDQIQAQFHRDRTDMLKKIDEIERDIMELEKEAQNLESKS